MKLIKKIIKNILKIMYIFPINNKKIFILSFGGKSKYGFDGRALIDYSNKQNLGYQFIWAIDKHDNEVKQAKNVKTIELKSIRGMYHAMTCGVFITNIHPMSYVPFRKKQVLVNTWHGHGMKKMPECDVKQVNMSNCFITHSKEFTDYLLKDIFKFKGDILKCGAPRNDVFFDEEEKSKREKEVREKFDIGNKKILLYAPTFRDDFEEAKNDLDYERIIKILNKKTNEEWVVIKRLHPLIANKSKIEDSDLVKDGSNYPDMQDLLCAASILITDYSSTAWDFSISKKPVFIYVYDYEEYNKSRGINSISLNRPYPMSTTEEQLILDIQNFDNEKYLKDLDEYFNRVEAYDKGQACYEIYNYISKRNYLN